MMSIFKQCRIEVALRYLSPVLVVILLVATSVAAAEQTTCTANSLPPVSRVFMRVRLEPSIRLSGLTPGEVVRGTVEPGVLGGNKNSSPPGLTVILPH